MSGSETPCLSSSMTLTTQALRRAPLLLLALGLTACQGGGGSGSSAAASGAAALTSAAPLTSAASAAPVTSGNAAPLVVSPGPIVIDEEQDLSLAIQVSDPDGDPLRVFVTGLPPGARWDEATRTLSFRPDFIQGGRTHTLSVSATDRQAVTTESFTLEVRDSITPPTPRILAREPGAGFTRLVVEQTSDAFLDSPTRAGRTYRAIVCVPDGASAQAPLPVRLSLHGFGGQPWREGWSGEFRIAPHDPDNTYWWGYADALPASPTSGRVEPYTQRRALHLLGWVLESYAGADPERVYVEGASMGGAGAAALGLLHARHFCYVRATYGQTIARNHRPSRLAQLSGLWGSPALNLPDAQGRGVWDRQDLTRALADSPEAREAYLFLHHGKDDGIIHFGAVTHQSPLTQRSFYAALQAERVGHLAVWDEGAHVSADASLPNSWWGSGWNPVFDGTSSLRRSASFPAFSQGGLDADPGDGSGNGNRAFDPESGYAADPGVVGDTGWSGARAGARNRFLRWDATKLVDTPQLYSIPLRVLDGPGSAPPRAGDPTLGDLPPSGRVALADVTLRRVSGFRCLPGETLEWSFGGLRGQVQADAEGVVTVPALTFLPTWQVLELTRVP